MEMREQLEKIWQSKRVQLNRLRKLNDDYLAEVYYGLANKKSVKEIHKAIRKVSAVNSKFIVDRKSEAYALALAKKGAKKQQGAVVLPLLFALDFLKKEEAYESTMSISYEYVRTKEGKSKEKVLSQSRDDEEKRVLDAIEKAKAEATGTGKLGAGKADKKSITDGLSAIDMSAKIFYLASEHGDCAEDHEDYQGELYYDRFWRRYVKTKEARRVVENLISNRRMRSMQWVIDRPVWFITRPNCRHYFAQVSIEQVVGNSASSLVSQLGLHQEIGRREDQQTITHSLLPSWYNRENILNIIDKYQRRLEYHLALSRKVPSPYLDALIAKDRRLIAKWKSYLKNKL